MTTNLWRIRYRDDVTSRCFETFQHGEELVDAALAFNNSALGRGASLVSVSFGGEIDVRPAYTFRPAPITVRTPDVPFGRR